jgi:hypothetical protein
LKQSPTHEGHELLPEEQRSTQQKGVLFQTLSYLVASHSEVSVLNILQSTSTTSLPNLQSTMNATVKESLSILNWINQSKQLFHIDVRLA